MHKKWIKNRAVIPESEIVRNALQFADGMYMAIYTDRVVCGRITDGKAEPGIADAERLLELRMFDRDSEFRAYRDTVGKVFNCRTADDRFFKENLDGSGFDGIFENRIYDEIHYLDIDETKTADAGEGFMAYTATGGGQYKLPVRARRIKLRSYIDYAPDTGNLQIADWRIVGFLPEVN
ncbi:MAG: CRISPR-associated protein Csx19 [Eubacteriales bacterium]|nr:CRISPR-associated protein Csx19 [Eubacteriales bacterium]